MSDRPERDARAAAPPPLFFRGTYDEAFDLLVEARNYVEYAVPALKFGDESPDQLTVTRETMRLTSRLTQVMAWLLAQRAVHEGEIGAEDFVEDRFRLEGQAVCLRRVIEDMDDLPNGLQDLMERSYQLYSRIQRLDDEFVNSRKPDS